MDEIQRLILEVQGKQKLEELNSVLKVEEQTLAGLLSAWKETGSLTKAQAAQYERTTQAILDNRKARQDTIDALNEEANAAKKAADAAKQAAREAAEAQREQAKAAKQAAKEIAEAKQTATKAARNFTTQIQQGAYAIQDFTGTSGGLDAKLNSIANNVMMVAAGFGTMGVAVGVGMSLVVAAAKNWDSISSLWETRNPFPETTNTIERLELKLKDVNKELDKLREKSSLSNDELARFNDLTEKAVKVQNDLNEKKKAQQFIDEATGAPIDEETAKNRTNIKQALAGQEYHRGADFNKQLDQLIMGASMSGGEFSANEDIEAKREAIKSGLQRGDLETVRRLLDMIEADKTSVKSVRGDLATKLRGVLPEYSGSPLYTPGELNDLHEQARGGDKEAEVAAREMVRLQAKRDRERTEARHEQRRLANQQKREAEAAARMHAEHDKLAKPDWELLTPEERERYTRGTKGEEGFRRFAKEKEAITLRHTLPGEESGADLWKEFQMLPAEQRRRLPEETYGANASRWIEEEKRRRAHNQAQFEAARNLDNQDLAAGAAVEHRAAAALPQLGEEFISRHSGYQQQVDRMEGKKREYWQNKLDQQMQEEAQRALLAAKVPTAEAHELATHIPGAIRNNLREQQNAARMLGINPRAPGVVDRVQMASDNQAQATEARGAAHGAATQVINVAAQATRGFHEELISENQALIKYIQDQGRAAAGTTQQLRMIFRMLQQSGYGGNFGGPDSW